MLWGGFLVIFGDFGGGSGMPFDDFCVHMCTFSITLCKVGRVRIFGVKVGRFGFFFGVNVGWVWRFVRVKVGWVWRFVGVMVGEVRWFDGLKVGWVWRLVGIKVGWVIGGLLELR